MNPKKGDSMNEIQIFSNPDFGQMRTLTIDGEPWFVGKDVADVLGYQNGSRDVNRHVDEEDRRVVPLMTAGQNRDSIIINESGLYSLILSSKLPGAKKFKRWVTSEVLPSIRKHGAYMTPETLQAAILNPDYLLQVVTALKDETDRRKMLEAENEQQRQLIADYEPKIQYVDTILSSTGTMATSQIAADYNMSANRLNKILHKAGIQHNVNGQWILYRDKMGRGYTKSITIPIVRSDGRPDTKMHTHWTQKGRLMIHEVLTSQGIQATMDLSAAPKE